MPEFTVRTYWSYPGEPDRVGVSRRDVEADSVGQAYDRYDDIPKDMPEGANFLNWVVFERGAVEPADNPEWDEPVQLSEGRR